MRDALRFFPLIATAYIQKHTTMNQVCTVNLLVHQPDAITQLNFVYIFHTGAKILR
jgi:hypothetical protein